MKNLNADPFLQAAQAAGAKDVTVIDGPHRLRISAVEPAAPALEIPEDFVARAESEAEAAAKRAADARAQAEAQAGEARVQRLEAGMAQLKDSLDAILSAQKRIEALLGMDVVAEYDEKGRVKRARREPRTGG